MNEYAVILSHGDKTQFHTFKKLELAEAFYIECINNRFVESPFLTRIYLINFNTLKFMEVLG